MGVTISKMKPGIIRVVSSVAIASLAIVLLPSEGHGNPPTSQESANGRLRTPSVTRSDDPLVDPVSERGQLARGMYITGPFVRVVGVDAMIERIKMARLDAAVIDLKDGAGRVTYDTQVEILEPQQRNFLGDGRALVQRLKDEGIYTIARIVCFADPQLPGRHPELAIMDNRRNRRGPWRSWGTAGTWLDPYNTANHDMIIELAKEAEAMGFEEIQLDYIRWPVDDGTAYAHYPALTEDSPRRWEVLKGFLGRMDAQVRIPIGIDVFGLTAFNFGNQRPLGQKLDELADVVEVFSPMLYINSMRTWGHGPPERDRRLIEAGVTQMRRRLGPQPVIRPFLQAFEEGADDPGPGFIARQIRGARRGGADGYLFWHPGSRYGMLYRAARGAARSENRPFPITARLRARQAALEDGGQAQAQRQQRQRQRRRRRAN